MADAQRPNDRTGARRNLGGGMAHGVVLAIVLLVAAAAPLVLPGPLVAAVWAGAGALLVWRGLTAGARLRPDAGRPVGAGPVTGGVTVSLGLLILAAACAHLMLWDAFPAIAGAPLAVLPVRAAGFLTAIGALYVAAYAYARFGGHRRTVLTLVAGASLLTLWYITLEVTTGFHSAHNGQAAGHESLALAGAWALYGLALAVAARRIRQAPLRNGARLVLGAALAYLTVGALLANARWALPMYRYGAYAAVLGGAWVAEWLFAAHASEDRDTHGMLSLVAALAGLFICNFEVVRWLEPAFTLADGQLLTPDGATWQRSMLAFWTTTAWSLYGLGIMLAGVKLGSWRLRLLSAGIFAAGLGYLLLVGAPHPVAPVWLRLSGYILAAGGATAAALGARRAEGQRHPQENLLWRVMPWVAAASAVAWGVFEVIR